MLGNYYMTWDDKGRGGNFYPYIRFRELVGGEVKFRKLYARSPGRAPGLPILSPEEHTALTRRRDAMRRLSGQLTESIQTYPPGVGYGD